MTDISTRAAALIENLPPRPWVITEMPTSPGGPVIATIRDALGYPVLAPHPESFSMLTGTRASMQYFALAANILDEIAGHGRNEPGFENLGEIGPHLGEFAPESVQNR